MVSYRGKTGLTLAADNKAVTKNRSQKKPQINLPEREVWRDIPGWEGFYQASNRGRFKSFDRNIRQNGFNVFYLGKWKGGIMKTQKNRCGYLIVSFSNGIERKTLLAHRLIAKTFLPNPDNLPQVNHKDENKTNNYIHINPDGTVNPELSNLEWCTLKYNYAWGTRNERIGKTITNGKTSKPVLQYTLDGEFVKEYPSQAEVERQTGFFQASISSCCRGKLKNAYGYLWKFKPND